MSESNLLFNFLSFFFFSLFDPFKINFISTIQFGPLLAIRATRPSLVV